jgi:hypothetical protein
MKTRPNGARDQGFAVVAVVQAVFLPLTPAQIRLFVR